MQIVAAAAMLIGILVVALPVTIVGTNFSDVYQMEKMSEEASKSAEGDTSEKSFSFVEHIKQLKQRRVVLGVWR